MVICLKRGADLHIAQLMSLPLTVSCFSKIQIGFTFLVQGHPGSPGKRAVKRVCVCVCVCVQDLYSRALLSPVTVYRSAGGITFILSSTSATVSRDWTLRRHHILFIIYFNRVLYHRMYAIQLHFRAAIRRNGRI